MNKIEFENILNVCCSQLTEEARRVSFKSASQFENRVREVLGDLTKGETSFSVDFNPHPQAFPDIAMGEYGVEVKFTLNDTWRSVANSVLETRDNGKLNTNTSIAIIICFLIFFIYSPPL